MSQEIVYWAIGLFLAMVAAEQVKNFFYFLGDLKDFVNDRWKFVTREELGSAVNKKKN